MMMNKSLLAMLSGLAFFAVTQGVFAADMPVKARMPVSIYDWTGFYVGGTVGAAWSTADVGLGVVNGATPLYRAGDIPALTALGSPGLSDAKAVFGGKIGYNKQWGTFVGGVEADFSSFRFNKSDVASGNPFLSAPPFAAGTAQFNTNVSTNWLATLRGRAGYAVDRALFYGTAGVAMSKIDYSNSYIAFSPLGLGFDVESTAASKTKLGWVIGAGVDYALTANWIVSAEYVHIDLGSINAVGAVTATAGGPGGPAATFEFSTRLKSDIVRASIAYKF
jgi:outer membrane immunogenic protein